MYNARNVPNISVPSESTNVMYLILYPYLLKVQRNVPNIIFVPSESTTHVMYLIYPYLPKVQRNVPNIISVTSESTT